MFVSAKLSYSDVIPAHHCTCCHFLLPPADSWHRGYMGGHLVKTLSSEVGWDGEGPLRSWGVQTLLPGRAGDVVAGLQLWKRMERALWQPCWNPRWCWFGSRSWFFLWSPLSIPGQQSPNKTTCLLLNLLQSPVVTEFGKLGGGFKI